MKIVNNEFEWTIYGASLDNEKIALICTLENQKRIGLKFYSDAKLSDVLRAIAEHPKYADQLGKDQMWLAMTDLEDKND